MAAEDYSNNISTALVLNLNTVTQMWTILEILLILEQWFSKDRKIELWSLKKLGPKDIRIQQDKGQSVTNLNRSDKCPHPKISRNKLV